MTVWQHVLDMDHLRRRAEGKIDAARRKKGFKSSYASSGRVGERYKSTVRNELDMGTDLADMTSAVDRED